MPSNGDIVRQFCDIFEKLDADELTRYFSADAIYHNIPMEPLFGHDAIRAFFKAIPDQFDGLRFEILNQVESGAFVMNERIDHFLIKGETVALPVAGIFELRDGKIKAWRDYFNLATLENRL
jgi:limonene-1,2-epoxide hydrolase